MILPVVPVALAIMIQTITDYRLVHPKSKTT